MEVIISIIITALICLGIGGTTGYIIGENEGYKKAPKEINIYNITDIDSKNYIETKQSTETKVMQGQITTIFNNAITNQIVNIIVKDLTNISTSFITNSNFNKIISNKIKLTNNSYINYNELLSNNN